MVNIHVNLTVLENHLEHVRVVVFYTTEERGLIQLQVMVGILRKPNDFHA
jgi:hypothetical protein